MARRNSEAYKEAFEKAMRIREKYGRMPYWNEFEKFLGSDLASVVKGLGVSSSKEISNELLREMRRREGKAENILDEYEEPKIIIPLSSFEKKRREEETKRREKEEKWQRGAGEARKHKEPH